MPGVWNMLAGLIRRVAAAIPLHGRDASRYRAVIGRLNRKIRGLRLHVARLEARNREFRRLGFLPVVTTNVRSAANDNEPRDAIQ